MKRYFSIILSLIMMLSMFAACSTPDDDEDEDPTDEVNDFVPEETDEPEDELEEDDDGIFYTHPLNGSQLSEAPDLDRPYAVMINNISTALPLCGISNADVMYEVLAEGGITRMVGIFSDIEKADDIGSIRSIRPYFLEIGLAYDAIIVHAGASEDAYSQISSQKIDTIDGVNGVIDGKDAEDVAFYRNQERNSAGYDWEHTLFTTPQMVKEASGLMGFRSNRTDLEYGLAFGDDPTPEDGFSGQNISVRYGDQKTSGFTYDPARDAYTMTEYGQLLVDGANEETQYFDNLIIIQADTFQTADDYGHMEISLIGSGDGWYFHGGKGVEIDWRHTSSGSAFAYSLKNGDILEMGAGRTFISIIPSTETPDYGQGIEAGDDLGADDLGDDLADGTGDDFSEEPELDDELGDELGD